MKTLLKIIGVCIAGAAILYVWIDGTERQQWFIACALAAGVALWSITDYFRTKIGFLRVEVQDLERRIQKLESKELDREIASAKFYTTRRES